MHNDELFFDLIIFLSSSDFVNVHFDQVNQHKQRKQDQKTNKDPQVRWESVFLQVVLHDQDILDSIGLHRKEVRHKPVIVNKHLGEPLLHEADRLLRRLINVVL